MYQFNPYAIPPLLASAYWLTLGLFIFIMRRRVFANFICGLVYYFATIWQFGYFMLYSSTDPTLFWPKFLYSGVIFIAPTFYHFSVLILNFKNQKKFVHLAYAISFCFLLLILFSDKFIIGLRRYFWGYHPLVNHFFHSLFLIFFAFVYSSGLKNLLVGYRQKKRQGSQPLELTRIKYLILVYAVSLLGAMDYIPDWGVRFYPFGGYIFVSIGITIFTYAIVKHRLLDISIVVTRTFIFVLVYTLVLGLPFIITGWFKDWLNIRFGINWWIFPLGFMALLATFGPFLYIYIDRKAERRLLREQHHYQEVLKKLAKEMVRIHSVDKILHLIVETLAGIVRISHSAVYLLDQESGDYILQAEAGCDLKKSISAMDGDNKNPLVDSLEVQKEALVLEEVKQKMKNGSLPIAYEKIGQQMQSLNAKVIVPSLFEDKLLAIIVLGDKYSRKIYTSEDLNMFYVLASEAALAINNSVLYENVEQQVKQRTQELVEVQRQLVQAEKLATMGTLAGGVAHEINNPLTAVLTNVQMLLASNKTEDSSDRESLELIEEATKRCRTIVQKLMTYAKRPLESIELSKINILDVITKAISFLEFQLEQENIKIILEAKDDQYLSYGEPIELEQVVTNIVLNGRDAIRLSNRGSGEMQVLLSKNNEWVKLRIKDDGAGISKETISKIFDPFFTTKDVGKGLGLGLSICHSIVEKYKGLISVSSEIDKGTIFTIQFPIARVAHAFKK